MAICTGGDDGSPNSVRGRGLRTLRESGGAARVEHLASLGFVDRLELLAGEHVVVAFEFRHVAERADPDEDLGEVELLDGVSHGVAGDQRGGAAVVEYVLYLAGLEMPVDRGVVQAGALSSPADFEEWPVVLHQDRDVIPRHDPAGPERAGEPHRPFLELGVGHSLAARTHYDRRSIRARVGMRSGCQTNIGPRHRFSLSRRPLDGVAEVG